MNILRYIACTVIIFISADALAATVKEIKTPGGFTAWLVEEHAQPLISVNIAFRNSGTAYDPNDKDGRTAITAAMLLEGAGDMDSESFSRALESSATKLSFSADTDDFYANLTMLREYKEKSFSYLGMALTKARLDDGAFDRVKRQTLTTIKQQQEKPNYRLSRTWQTQIFGTHPYSKEELGTEETVANIKQSDLLYFTKNYLTRANIIISVVGDVTADELSTLLDKNLENLPADYKPDVKLEDVSTRKDAKQTVVEQDIPQTIVQFGFEGLKRDDKDYITGFVVNYLLGGGSLTSRLNDELREKRGLTYSASSMLIPLQHAAVFEGRFATRNEKVGEALSVLKQTLKEFADNPASEKQLADAKRFLTGSFVVGLDSNNSIVNFLTMMQLHHLGIDYMDKRNSLINMVTKKQVDEMAKRLIQLDKLQLVMVGNPQFEESSKP